MARRDRDVEIIEVLDPDDRSLGWEVARHGPVEPPGAPGVHGRRWPWVALSLVVVGVVAAVVVSAVRDRTPPEPPPVLADGKYLVDDPSVRSYSADIVTPPDHDASFLALSDGAPGAHRWVTVETQRTPTPPVFVDATTREFQGLTLVVSTDDPAQVSAVRPVDDDWSVVVRASGMADPEVASLVGAVAADRVDGALVVSLGDTAGTPIVTANDRDEAVYGVVATRMTYLDANARLLTLRIAAGDLAAHTRTLSYLAERPPETVDGRLVATLPDTDESLVMWEQDGHLLSLSGIADRPTLVALSKEVRQATEDEWHTRLIFLRPDYRVGDFTTIATDAQWRAGVQRAERGGADRFLWWFTLPGEPFRSVSVPVRFDPVTMPFADRIVVGDVTYAFVSMPGSTGVTTATIDVGDGAGVELTLRRAFVDVDAVFAVYRVDVPGDVRVFAPGLPE